MEARLRDPAVLFRGRGAPARRVGVNWSVPLQGPKGAEVGGWFPRDDLGEGEWLWAWKWAALYEQEFAFQGEWVFSGLPPRQDADGQWIFEASSPELYWLAAEGNRSPVLEEDARGVLRVLESDDSISTFYLESGDGRPDEGVIHRRSEQARPRMLQEAVIEEVSRQAGADLLALHLLAAEILSDPRADRLKGLRRVASLLLSSLEATEFEWHRQGVSSIRLASPRVTAVKRGEELRELSGSGHQFRWSIRGPRVSEFPAALSRVVTRVLSGFQPLPSIGSPAPGSPN